MPLAARPLADRLWARVLIPLLPNGTPDYDACWLWGGARSAGAGGRLSGCLSGGPPDHKTLYAHRAALILVTGQNPPDLDACHSEDCISPLCCNAYRHLRWGSHRENMRQFAAQYGRWATGRWRGRSAPLRPIALFE